MTKSLLTSLIIGLTALVSSGQESPMTESPPNVAPGALGSGDHTRTVLMAEGKADDVAFIGKLLDDLETVLKVDEKRIYACGMSNGGMMCYRLAAEMSDRITAIAPVAGTIAIEECKPKRAMPVIHFHGSKDKIVPFEITKDKTPRFMKLKGVEESIQTWVKLNGCDEKGTTDTISTAGDEIKVTRSCYRGGKDGSEVVLVVIEEGGHTWPGQKPPVGFIGKSALNISANDLM